MSGSGFAFENNYYHNMKYFDEDEVETVLIWVEDSSDIAVWTQAFPLKDKIIFEFQTTDMFDFGDDKVSTGCDRIASLIKAGTIILGKNIIVCLDSDYHTLTKFNKTKRQELYENNHVYLTKTHSIENIKHYSSNMDIFFSRSIGTHESQLALKPSDIAMALSKEIFGALTKYLFLETLQLTKATHQDISNKHKDILKTLIFISKADEKDLKNNTSFFSSLRWKQGSSRFQDIEKNLNNIIKNNSKLDDYNTFKNELAGVGISDNNTYLFLRGHDIEDFFCEILDKSFKSTLDEKIKRLKAVCAQNKLKADAVKEKIAHIERTYKPYSDISNATDYNLSQIPFFCDTYNRISQDYV